MFIYIYSNSPLIIEYFLKKKLFYNIKLTNLTYSYSQYYIEKAVILNSGSNLCNALSELPPQIIKIIEININQNHQYKIKH